MVPPFEFFQIFELFYFLYFGTLKWSKIASIVILECLKRIWKKERNRKSRKRRKESFIFLARRRKKINFGRIYNKEESWRKNESFHTKLIYVWNLKVKRSRKSRNREIWCKIFKTLYNIYRECGYGNNTSIQIRKKYGSQLLKNSIILIHMLSKTSKITFF